MNLDEEDLSKEVYPLAHYISNRKKLINEVFTILKGPRLESTVPPSLKGIDVVELKALCLEELEKLDTMTILDVIEGKLKAKSPSRSPPGVKEVAPEQKKRKSSETFIPLSTLKKKIKQSLKGTDEAGVKVQIKVTKKKKDKKKKDKKNSKKGNTSDSETASKKKVKAKLKKTKKEKKAAKAKKKDESVQEESVRPTSHTGERTLMELLELEYRAKAIKALLKFQGVKGAKLDQIFNDDNDSSRQSDNNDAELLETSSASGPKSTSQTKNEENDNSKLGMSPQQENAKHGEIVQTSSVEPDDVTSHSEIQIGDRSNDEADEDIDGIPTNLIQPRVNKTVSSFNENDDDALDYGNPDDLEDDLTKAVSSSSSSDCSDSSLSDDEVEEGNIDADIKDTGDQDTIEGAIDVSEEEEGELGDDDNQDANSTGSTPPHLSPAYSDAGDYQVTLRNTPSPASPCRNIVSESDQAVEGLDEEVNREDLEASVVEELSDGEIDENEIIITPVTPVAEITPNEAVILELEESAEVCETTEVEPETLTEDTSVQMSSSETTQDEEVSASNVVTGNEIEQEIESVEKIDDDEMSVNARAPSDTYPDEATPISWYERWYSSEKVQQVVSSTKMYGKVRSKLKTDKQAKLKLEASEEHTAGSPNPNLQPNIEDEDVPIIGSIEEYEKLFGRKIVEQNLDNVSKQEPEVSTIPLPPESPEEASEPEDDDLWGDILGGS